MERVNALLEPFFGYVHLKMYAEANEVLENLPTELKTHPRVLLARLDLLIKFEKLEEGVLLGQSLCGLWPSESEFWFRTAVCLHWLKRTQEAKDTLLSAPVTLRESAVYYYDLACYETQLGDLEAAKQLLDICFRKNKSLRQSAIDDPDLEPLWRSFDKA